METSLFSSLLVLLAFKLISLSRNDLALTILVLLLAHLMSSCQVHYDALAADDVHLRRSRRVPLR